MKGKVKLLKRQLAGECVLCRTDKSGKLCVLSKDLYIKKMTPHIVNDVVVDREEINTSERFLNASFAQLAKVFKIGSDIQHEDRVKSALTVSYSKIPALGQLLKNHKPEVAHGEGSATTPVGYASEAPNGPLSDLVGKVLGSFISEMDSKVGIEAASTEEVKSRIQNINDTIERVGTAGGPYQRDGGLVTASLDFDAYFPSLDIEKCADIAREAIENLKPQCNAVSL